MTGVGPTRMRREAEGGEDGLTAAVGAREGVRPEETHRAEAVRVAELGLAARKSEEEKMSC